MKKTLAILVIFAAISIILVFFGIFPLFKKIQKNSEDMLSIRKESVLLKTKSENLGKFQEIYKNLEKDAKKISRIFVNPEIPLDFIQFLEETASGSHLSINIFPTVPKSSPDDIWQFLGFQLNLEGSFPNFLKFLEKLENSSYLIEIRGLTIRKAAKEEINLEKIEEPSEIIRADIAIKVYASQPGKIVPAGLVQ